MKYKYLITISIIMLIFLVVPILSDSPQEQSVIIDRTASTETINNGDGTFTKTLYSGTRFVEEDSQWKKIEDAKSLKNHFNEIYLEDDNVHKIEVVDFNYSSIIFNFSYDENSPNISEFEYELEDGKMKTKYKVERYNETSNSWYEEEIEIEIEEGGAEFIILYENPFGKRFHLGENSTTITLQDADTENLEDVEVYYYDEGVNQGSDTSMAISFSDNRRNYLKFNMSFLSGVANISESLLIIYTATGSGGENVSVHQVNNQTWSEDVLVWNNQPCGSADSVLSSPTCNQTAADTITIGADENIFNVTSIVKSFKDKQYENISFVLTDFGNTPSSSNFRTKENSNTLERPSINITYTIILNANINYPTSLSYLNNNISIPLNFTIENTTTLDTCIYSLNNFITNTTIADCTNTTFNKSNGNYLLQLWVNDTAGYNVNTSVNFTIDTLLPQITFLNPTNNTNTTDTTLDINYSVIDINLDSCWWNNGTTNITLSSCENITGEIWSDNHWNITVYANDSAGNENSSSVSFRIDTIEPSINIISPAQQYYSTNESLELNYSAIDNLLEIDTCWYNIINATDGTSEISNNTITNCDNTIFNVSGDGTYNLTLFANDTLGNENFSVINFGVSLLGPAISLDYPTNPDYFSNGINIYFNFTGTDSDGLDYCILYGNFSGTWESNYTWLQPTNTTQNFTILNLSENKYIWNVWCNDTYDNSNYALNNFTVFIDESKPFLSIDSIQATEGSQTIQFINTITDLTPTTCKYSIFNSTGGIDGTNENVSFICNSQTSATVTLYGTYNLTIYAIDSASNENSTSQSFTTQEATVTEGGGGGGGTTGILVIALIRPDLDSNFYLNEDRARIYQAIYEFCGNDTSECSLYESQISELTILLQEIKPFFDDDLTKLWLEQYNNNQVENVELALSTVNTYNLLSAVVEFSDAAFSVTPRRLDVYWFVLSKNFRETIKSTETLSTCRVLDGNGDWFCEISDTTADITLNIEYPPTWTFKTYEATVVYTNTEGENVFQEVRIRAIYPSGSFILFSSGMALLSVFLFVFRKSVKKQFNRLTKSNRKLFK